MLLLQPGRCGLRQAMLSRHCIAHERVLSVHASQTSAAVQVQHLPGPCTTRRVATVQQVATQTALPMTANVPPPRLIVPRRPRLVVFPTPSIDPWDAHLNDTPIATPVDINFCGRPYSVVPVWVNIHYNPDVDQYPRMYVTAQPMHDDLWQQLGVDGAPQPLGRPVHTYPYSFAGADVCSGHWYNYYVAMTGAVSAFEHQTLWPNGVRRCNSRGDGGKSQRSTDVEAHVANLKRRAAQEGWTPAFVVRCLVQRWGANTLQNMGILPFVSL